MVFVWASGRKGRALAGEWDRVRLGVLEERQDWGVGPLDNKVWVQPESLAGSAPRPCGHKDLIRILRPQVVGISDAAQEGSVRKPQQSRRRSRARVHSEARGEIADLPSEFLARMLGSAGAGSSVVVVPTPTDPAGIRSVREI